MKLGYNFFLRFAPVTALLAALLSLLACSPASGPASSVPAATQAATKLVFTIQPGDGTAGAALAPQPVVAAVDAGGNIVTGYRSPLTVAITPGSGAGDAGLFGGTQVAPSGGVFRFTSLNIGRAASGYTLTARSGALSVVSSPFAIAPGAPAKLAFTVAPTRGTASVPLTAEVTVEDMYENAVAGYDGSVTIGITFGVGPKDAVLAGTTTVRVTGNKARFTDLWLNKAVPDYTLTAVSGALTTATTDKFEIVHAAGVKLEFTVPPADAIAGTPFYTQPKVAVEDAYGNVATASRVTVTVALTPGSGSAGAKLSGTLTRVTADALGGLAEFADLSIDRAGTGYTLSATSASLKSAASQAFDVVVP